MGSEDGRAIQRIMNGIGFLAFGLIIPTIISLIFTFITNHHPGFRPTETILNNYLLVSILLVLFMIIGNGARYLTDIGNNRPSLGVMRVFMPVFVALTVAFTCFVLKYYRAHPRVYYFNTALLIITIIIPYLFSWFVRLLSVYEFRIYAKYVNGLIYRRALRQLSRGIVITIVGNVVIQFLENTVIAIKAAQSLGLLLVFEYTLLVIIAIGLALIEFGTSKLKKIEEV